MTKREKDKALATKRRVAIRAAAETALGFRPTAKCKVDPSDVLALLDATEPLTDAEAGAIQAVSEVETLRRSLRDLREVAFDGPSEPKGSGCREGYSEWRTRIDRETKALLDDTTPTSRIFTEAEVREVVQSVADGGSGVGPSPLMQSMARTIFRRLGLTLD